MSAPGAAAPDVDLAERGLDSATIAAALAIAFGLVLLLPGSGGATGEELEEVGPWESFLATVRLLPWAVLRGAQLVAALSVMLLALLIVKQRSILYVPTPPGAARSPQDNPPQCSSPAFWGLPFEDVTLVAADGTRLHAWFIYQPQRKCTAPSPPYTFVYFHGNAGNIGHRLENICDMYTQLGINILILDYRCYGNSDDGGGPSQDGFMMDAMATYEWLVRRIDDPPHPERATMSRDRIIIFGRSIGGCVGICLAARLLRERSRECAPGTALPLPAGIVLENCFTSLKDMAVTVFPALHCIRGLLRPPIIFDEWRADEDLDYFAKNHEQWSCCMLSGLDDRIVPPVQMRQLHGVLKRHPPKVLRFHTFPQGGHNDTPTKGGLEYWASLREFLALSSSE